MKAETGNSSRSKLKPGKPKSSSRSHLDDNLSVRSDEYKETAIPRTHCRDHPSHQLAYYCETCEDLACQECRISGPHNNQEHWVLEIDNAYQSRFLKIGFLLSNKLAERRNLILQEIQKIAATRNTVLEHGEAISDETKEVFSGILGRLSQAAEPKMARLTAEVSEVQQNLQETSALIEECAHAANTTISPLFLLSKWSSFRIRIQSLLSKQFNKEILETPYDLPRELTELRQELEEMNNYEAMLAYKNHIMYKVMQDNFEAEREIELRNKDELEQTLSFWAETSQKLMDELKSKSLVCFFCALPMEENTINSGCGINSPHNMNLTSQFEGFSDERPDFDYFGSGAHYFAQPNSKKMQDPHVMNILHTHTTSGGANPYKSSLLADLQTSLNRIRVKLDKSGTGMESLVYYLRGFDQHEIDTLNFVSLAYAMNEAFGVEESDLHPIMTVLDPFKKSLVHLVEFSRLIFQPEAVEQIPFFFYAENSMVQGYQQYLNKFEGYRQKIWEQEQAIQKVREQEMIQFEKQRLWLEKEAAKLKKPGDKSSEQSSTGGRPRLRSRDQ